MMKYFAKYIATGNLVKHLVRTDITQDRLFLAITKKFQKSYTRNIIFFNSMAVFLFHNIKKNLFIRFFQLSENLLRSGARFSDVGKTCSGMEQVFRTLEKFAPEWSKFFGRWKNLPRNGASFPDKSTCRSNLEQNFQATGRLVEFCGRLSGRQDGFKKRIFTNQILLTD
jgi:hypothetical protein